MEKLTKEKTIGSHKIVYKDYMTKMDRLNIQEASASKVTQETGATGVGVEMTYVKGEIATIKSVLVSVDDREGDAMASYVLEMPEKESDPIFALINEVTEKNAKNSKKK